MKLYQTVLEASTVLLCTEDDLVPSLSQNP